MIYCVEDDKSIRELVVYALQSGGMPARGFAGGNEFFAALREQKPDLVLLDIMLPGEDGITILKRLKANAETKDMAVIMLTAKSGEYDKIWGLDSGADDYITKPFGIMELISRVKAVLRRTQPQPQQDKGKIFLDGISLDEETHVVTIAGKEVELTFKEFALLQYLMANAGVALSRDKVLTNVWGYEYEGETRTVDVHIRSLRQKLGKSGDAIETVRGIGYRIKNNKN